MPIISIAGIDNNQGKNFFNDVILQQIVPLIGGNGDNINLVVNQSEIFANSKRIVVKIDWLKRPAEIEHAVTKIITKYFKNMFSDADIYLIFNEINEQLYVNGNLK